MNYYIGGDFNINVLMYAKRPQINNYCNIAHSMASHMIINKPTRFPVGYQNGKPSILDHIYLNNPSNIMQAGLIVNDMTDHYPIFSIINSPPNRKRLFERAMIRNLKKNDQESFDRE